MEEHLGLPHSGSPSRLKSSRVEPVDQKESKQQANFCGKGKPDNYQHQHELQQQLQHTDRASSKLKPHVATALGKLLPSTDMHLHEQQPMEGQGWGRSHRQKGDEDQNISLSFPAADQSQCEQQELKCQGQERQLSPRGQGASQPELSASDITMVLLPWGNQHAQQHQRKVPLPTVLPNQNDHQQVENRCLGRLPTPTTKADVPLQESITVDHPNHNELQQQQPERRDRGRKPSKPNPVLATTMEALLPSQQQEQPQYKRRGRPPIRKGTQTAWWQSHWPQSAKRSN
ncbi:hypothetical protein CJ030_MR6G010792 [Morella rubra]|uniref:Uncharacterized protein n=1 Tax=Morella rubra TaxID=262757 RepID=A0A6A1VE94_9ROSI|nr:hypothetical protein CJ030_MR6G010792 [Morella rubra]